MYRYSAFEFSNEIRLLVLQPGNHTDELRGALIHTELALCSWGHITGFEPDCPGRDMTKARLYEVLSYMWVTKRSQEIRDRTASHRRKGIYYCKLCSCFKGTTLQIRNKNSLGRCDLHRSKQL